MVGDIVDPVQVQQVGLEPDVSQRTTAGWAALPLETMCHIFCLLDPRDLIRLRAVRAPFRAIIDDPALWRTIYTARLLLPPGPFTWQSTRFLQHMLVHSARVASTWTTRPLVHFSERIYTDPRPVRRINGRLQWVCGRWLITTKDMKQMWVHDVEGGSGRMLWDHGLFALWGSTSVMSERGHLIYVFVHLGKGRLGDPVKLLEFVVDDDTGHWSDPETFDVPTYCLPLDPFKPSILIDSGIAPYVYISCCNTDRPRNSLVFDPRHRRFYKFPPFRTQLDTVLRFPEPWLHSFFRVHFTRTHLLVLFRCRPTPDHFTGIEVVQTFTFPDMDDTTHAPPNSASSSNSESVPASNSDSNGDKPIVHELRLTHEMAIDTGEELTGEPGSVWLTPIRDSTIDPITHATTLRFMHTYVHPSGTQTQHVCIDYVLPASRSLPISASAADDRSPGASGNNDNGENDNNNTSLNALVSSVEDVLPITTTRHVIFSVEGSWRANLVDVSHDGFVRGFCAVAQYGLEGRSHWSDIPIELIHKFSVDATGELCVAAVSDPSPPRKVLKPQRYHSCFLDGTRGRVWNTEEQNPDGDRSALATVIDYA